ncbi:MAG: Zn-dependent hydrolase [Gammaproteobacteria bacterium]|nr:Zn-dependent hydrolase [Gammaproteobacteria bacterium]
MYFINVDRLWDSLMQMAQIGRTEKGGCNRQALTDLDKQGRDLFISWCHELGMSTRYDEMGNLFARLEGTQPNLPPIITGSHLDTQPTGGKFDGVYGVLAGLEVARTIVENKLKLTHPFEIIAWTNEEGARFSPAMIGSGVWAGEFDLNYGWSCSDKNGVTIKDELNRLAMLGKTACKAFDVAAAFELHIEQGPILEAENTQIGVVTGVQGIKWFDVEFIGKPAHAGPTPMKVRKDPMRASAALINKLYELTDEFGEWSRVTFGDIKVEPGSRNTVPEKLTLAVDLRHPDNAILNQMNQRLEDICRSIEQHLDIKNTIKELWHSPAIEFSNKCINAVEQSVKDLALTHKKMVSGAGHDSVYVSKVAPTSMIFIPCKDGLSHNELESATKQDIGSGANVLLNAILNSTEYQDA